MESKKSWWRQVVVQELKRQCIPVRFPNSSVFSGKSDPKRKNSAAEFPVYFGTGFRNRNLYFFGNNQNFWKFFDRYFWNLESLNFKNTCNVRQCVPEIPENTGNFRLNTGIFGLRQNFGQGFWTLFSGKFSVSFTKLLGVRNPCLFSIHFPPSKFGEGRYTGKVERPKIFG